MLRSLVSAAAILIMLPSAHAAEMRYTTLIMGNPAGVQTTTVQPDGSRNFAFEYNDRGRGPKLTSHMTLDAEGVPTSVETSGNDYLKAPVKETFSVRDGVASWKNDSEKGQRKLDGEAFYLSMQGMPEEEAVLAAALLKTPGHRMALLPEGEASIRRTGEMTVSHGGQSRRVISYEISGLGFTPSTVWLNPDNSWFASVSSWASFVPEGWEPVVPELLAKQDGMEAQRTVEIARTLTRKPNGPLAIVNARLFDAETGKTIPDATVVVVGNRIQSVGTGKNVAIPAGAETIDARGRALLPGLWDMHVHVGPNDGVMHIAAGVTSVRDLANDNER